MSHTFINRLTSSDDAIVKVLLGNMVARERMWEYWYSILYYTLECLSSVLDILY